MEISLGDDVAIVNFQVKSWAGSPKRAAQSTTFHRRGLRRDRVGCQVASIARESAKMGATVFLVWRGPMTEAQVGGDRSDRSDREWNEKRERWPASSSSRTDIRRSLLSPDSVCEPLVRLIKMETERFATHHWTRPAGGRRLVE